MTVSPPQYFEIKGQVYPVLSVFGTVNAAANADAVAASSGKKVLVLRMVLQSNNAANIGTVQFYDNTTLGTLLWSFSTPAKDVNPPQHFPFDDVGYFETTAGNALRVAGVTHAQQYFLNYIQYTP